MSSTATVILALVVSVIAPLVLALVSNRHARKMKEQDWAREDIVAERAERATKLLAAGNEVLKKQNDVIHTLVNNQMTKAYKAQLAALEANLILLRDAVGPERTAAIGSVSDQIAVLKGTLKDRAEQTAIADMQVVQVQRAEEVIAEIAEVPDDD